MFDIETLNKIREMEDKLKKAKSDYLEKIKKICVKHSSTGFLKNISLPYAGQEELLLIKDPA